MFPLKSIVVEMPKISESDVQAFLDQAKPGICARDELYDSGRIENIGMQ